MLLQTHQVIPIYFPQSQVTFSLHHHFPAPASIDIHRSIRGRSWREHRRQGVFSQRNLYIRFKFSNLQIANITNSPGSNSSQHWSVVFHAYQRSSTVSSAAVCASMQISGTEVRLLLEKWHSWFSFDYCHCWSLRSHTCTNWHTSDGRVSGRQLLGDSSRYLLVDFSAPSRQWSTLCQDPPLSPALVGTQFLEEGWVRQKRLVFRVLCGSYRGRFGWSTGRGCLSVETKDLRQYHIAGGFQDNLG